MGPNGTNDAGDIGGFMARNAMGLARQGASQWVNGIRKLTTGQIGVPATSPTLTKAAMNEPAMHPAVPAGGHPPVSAFPSVATPQSAHLPPWARQQVRAGNGNPQSFVVEGNQLMGARTPQQLADTQKPLEHPPITTQAGAALIAKAAPTGMPSVGVQGAAATPMTSAPPGIQTVMPSKAGGPATISQSPSRATSAPVAGDQFEAAMRNSLRDVQETFRGGNTQAYAEQAARVANLADAFQKYRLGGAQASAADPNTRIDQLRTIAKDPTLRGVYLAGQGADPATIAEVGRIAGPEGAEGAAPAESATLLDRLRQLKSVQGAADPNHPQHLALQQWVNQRFANPADWSEETYIPPNPGDTGMPSFLSRPLGVFGAMSHGLFGEGHSLGTGIGWPQHFADRTEQQELLNRIGIRPPGSQMATGY